jgi:hypothetical protein
MSKLASGSTVAGNPIWHNGLINSQLIPNGSVKLPNGLILQWGMYYHTYAGDEEAVAITFDRSFSTQVFSVVVSALIPANSSAGSYDTWAQVVYPSITLDGFRAQLQSPDSDAGSYGLSWFAIGI